MSLQTFTDAYMDAILFTSTDESTPQGGEPLDRNFDRSDFAPEALETIRADCERFYEAHSDWDDACLYTGCTPDEYAGHDFWLTRNGHGAGFWDGDWDEPLASRLTEAAKAAGEQNAYLGDDGRIYLA